MKLFTRFFSIAAICTALTLQACGSAPVKDSDRDTSGAFDGKWLMSVDKFAGLQYIENWNFTCDNPAFANDMIIKGGKVIIKPWRNSGRSYTTNIDSKGRFKFELPLNSKASSSGASATTIANGNTKLIVSGNLRKSSGSYMFGIQQFGWQGCRSKVNFTKT